MGVRSFFLHFFLLDSSLDDVFVTVLYRNSTLSQRGRTQQYTRCNMNCIMYFQTRKTCNLSRTFSINIYCVGIRYGV